MNKFISVMLVLCLAASTVFGILNFTKTRNLETEVAKLSQDEEDPAREDDVVIAGEYEIKSTKQISDAYISGDSSSLSDRDKETLSMAEDVIKEYTNDDMTDYEKEYAIYKYLTSEMKNDTGLLTVVPTSSEEGGEPYGVLKYKSAVCVGYATTMRMFMQMFGIDCKVVHSSDLTHSWDLVNLDGDWYHVDCYMDSNSNTERYFNNTDSMMSDTHAWNSDFFPKANGMKYCPVVNNSEEIEDIYSFPEWFSGKYEDLDGETAFSCSFKKAIGDDETETAKYIVDTILNGVNNMSESGYFESVWTQNENNGYVCCIFYSDYNEDSGASLSDEQKEKADEAISQYFSYALDDYTYYGDIEGDY